MDAQNPPKAAEPASGFGCNCVRKADLPPPPPLTLPFTSWDVDQFLPAEAVRAAEQELFQWKMDGGSAYGLLHMAGNAAEWVYDVYEKDYYGRSPLEDPQGPEEGSIHGFRGGSYVSEKPDEITVFRRTAAADPYTKKGLASGKHRGAAVIGFRCAKSLDLALPVDSKPKTSQTP
jgi:hypothetical protein